LSRPAVIDQSLPCTFSNNAPKAYPLGKTVVTWNIADRFGNATAFSQNVIVVDTTSPVFTKIPEPVTVTTTSIHAFIDLGGVATGAIAGYDIFPFTITNDSPGEFFQGTTTVWWSATDVNGNKRQVSQQIIVKRPAEDTLQARIIGGRQKHLAKLRRSGYDGNEFIFQRVAGQNMGRHDGI
jgi:hypothetical protein